MAIQSNLGITIQMLDWIVYAFEATVKHYYAYLNLIFYVARQTTPLRWEFFAIVC